jgi:putative spermidine/putrescine transport system permease protein
MTALERVARITSWIVAAFVVVFLLTPIVVTLLVSFTSSSVYTLPPPQWSVRWFAALADKDGLVDALLLSLNLALVSTIISLVLGTATALAVSRGRFPGREAIATFVVSPLMMPGLVVGVALLQFFRSLGLSDAYLTLTLAHVVVTLPYVMRTLLAAFASFNYTLLDAARTLGMPYGQAVLRVMVPALSPAFLTAGLFSFLASMDNYPISIFLTDARNKTLPVKMLQYMEESPDPSIAAISSGLIMLALLALMLGSRTVGLNRMIQG